MNQAARRKRKTPDSVPSEPSAEASVPSRDTMLVHGISEDGQSLAVLRARDDRIESGVVRQLKEGEPITGELVRLTPRPETPLLCDVEVTLPASATRSFQAPPPREASAGAQSPKLSHGGPAQVATPSYRQNWDAIWNPKKKPSAPN